MSEFDRYDVAYREYKCVALQFPNEPLTESEGISFLFRVEHCVECAMPHGIVIRVAT